MLFSVLENHELNEQLMLINQLDEDEKNDLIKKARTCRAFLLI
jgi:hypothetical protein